MDPNEFLADAIAVLMDERQVTQTDLVKATDIPKATLQRRLSSYDQMRYGEFRRIARALGVRPSEILVRAEALEGDRA